VTQHSPRLTPLLLGVLGFTGAVSPLATDMYLASFGSIQQDLNTTASLVQLTLSMFFLGAAVGQLVIGPLSDRFGRRPLLLGFLTVYAAAGIALVFTPSIEIFVALRLLLGFTGAAGIVLARAIAVDLSEGETAVKALSLIAMMGGLGPLLAPPIGALTHELWGWRGTLATLAGISVLILMLAWRFIPESLPPELRRSGGLLAVYAPLGSIIRTPRYMFFALAFVFGFSAMIAYISGSPFVGLNVIGMSPVTYAFGFAVGGAALISANIVNANLAPRRGPARMLSFGIALLLTGTAALLLLSLTSTLAVWSFITCAAILTAGAGFTMSNASALALAEAMQARGMGAAVLGSMQFAVGGLLAPVVGAWGEHTAVPMGAVALSSAVIAALCALLAARSPRRSPDSASR
jgi:DHA1 family bicyclomycin/chloramphenicol resistance-like MFS transporter